MGVTDCTANESFREGAADGRVRVRVRKRQAAVYAESGWSEKTLKRPYLEMGVCFELLNST